MSSVVIQPSLTASSTDSSLVYVKTMEGIIIGVSTSADSLRIDWRSPAELGYELAPTALKQKDGILLVDGKLTRIDTRP